MTQVTTKLTDLPEIGSVTAGQLTAVGVADADQLSAIGAKAAFLLIRDQLDPGACVQLLQGLEAAVRGLRAPALPPEVKADLRAWFRALPPAGQD